MTRGESTFLRIAHWAVALSGLVWAWMIYFAVSSDPYAAVNHPWQPRVQAAHILAAPALLLAVGLIWKAHAWSRIRSGFQSRRGSGIALALLFLPMAASGYLLEVTVNAAARATWSWIHLASSLAWVGCWILHRRARRAAAKAA